jgi:iron complex outermembrane receptor protein
MNSKSQHVTIIVIFSVYANLTLAQNEVNTKANLTAERPTTGTQLKHTAESMYGPLQTYTRADILQSGENNVADFLRSLPINSLGSFRPLPGTTSQENTVISLRGLGSGNSLVLIDGRRVMERP